MKLQLIRCLVALGLVCAPLAVAAQRKSSELIAIEERLMRSFEENRPTWKHETGTAIQGSADVAIHHWMGEDGGAGVTMVRYGSKEEAQKHIRQFARDMRATDRTPEDSDEAFSMNDGSKSVTLRKQQFILYIYVIPRDSSDYDRLIKEITKLALRAIH